MKKIIVLLVFLFSGVTTPLFATIKLPAIISDNMVLQQKEKVALWGWNTPNTEITITNAKISLARKRR